MELHVRRGLREGACVVRRHILVVTEATYRTICNALTYAISNAEFAECDGDHDEAAVRSFERARDAIKKTSVRDVTRDGSAIMSMMYAATDNSCSCVDLERGHTGDCFVRTSRHEIDRATDVAKLLQGGGA